MEQTAAGTPRSIEAGRVVAALGAIALLVGLFLDWYSSGIPGRDDAVSAWTVFEVVDLLLALLALATLLAVADRLAPRPLLPAAPGTAVGAAGFAALVLVTTSLVNDPPAASGASLEEGIWISFAGAFLMALGAVLGHSRISFVVTPRETEPRSDPERDETETQVLRRR